MRAERGKSEGTTDSTGGGDEQGEPGEEDIEESVLRAVGLLVEACIAAEAGAEEGSLHLEETPGEVEERVRVLLHAP